MTHRSPASLDRPAGAGAPALMQVVGIAKRYGEQRALADVSFAVQCRRGARPDRPQRRRQDHLAGSDRGPAARGRRSRSLARNVPSLSQRRELMFYLPDGAAPLGRPVRGTPARILRGRLWPAREDRRGNDRRARPRAGSAQARRRIVERLWPPAHAGAGADRAATPAADGRAVRRLRPPPDARDHGRGPRGRAQCGAPLFSPSIN